MFNAMRSSTSGLGTFCTLQVEGVTYAAGFGQDIISGSVLATNCGVRVTVAETQDATPSHPSMRVLRVCTVEKDPYTMFSSAELYSKKVEPEASAAGTMLVHQTTGVQQNGTHASP